MVKDLEGDWVRLKDGSYSTDTGGSHFDRIYLGIGRFVFADLNADGYEDAIALLSENDGGSAIANSLVIFLNRRGTPIFTTSYYIGDRECYDSIKVRGDTLDTFLRVHGPNDPLCCPTTSVERKLQLIGDSLMDVK